MPSKTIIITITVLLVSIGTSFLALYTNKHDQDLTSKEITTCIRINNNLMDNPVDRILTFKQTVHKVREGICIVKNYTILGIPFSIVEVYGINADHQSDTFFEVARRLTFFGIPF